MLARAHSRRIRQAQTQHQQFFGEGRQKQLREERGGHSHPIRCLGARSSPLRVSSLWQAWEGEEKGMVTLNAGL
uniref:Uncharacterized protein n=1 Tax=Oryza barthii TaxID=65489 RepID=A0A0D3GQR6_9ORYZ